MNNVEILKGFSKNEALSVLRIAQGRFNLQYKGDRNTATIARLLSKKAAHSIIKENGYTLETLRLRLQGKSKICPTCGREFKAVNDKQVYCNDPECKLVRDAEHQIARNIKRREEELGREIPARKLLASIVTDSETYSVLLKEMGEV